MVRVQFRVVRRRGDLRAIGEATVEDRESTASAAFFRLANMTHQKKQFAICVRNEGAEDLEIRKVYQILPDARAAKDKHVRVIDESGEDYLYPAEFFIPLTLPREVERALSTPTR